MAYARRRETGSEFLNSLRVVPLYLHFDHPKFAIVSTDGIRAHAKQIWKNKYDIAVGARPEFLLVTAQDWRLKVDGLELARYAPSLAQHFDEQTRADWQRHFGECRAACGKVWRGGRKTYPGRKVRAFSYI